MSDSAWLRERLEAILEALEPLLHPGGSPGLAFSFTVTELSST